ncbi:TraR/DksA family transcriptional regulator [Thiobacillus denitrificans]|nr:TraR/DksA family transcriptional regulator [Thiobacillus denitrificans]
MTQIKLFPWGKEHPCRMNTSTENPFTPLRAWLLARETELLAEIGAAREAAIDAAAATGIAATDVNDLEDQASKRERTTLQDAEVQRDRKELADVRAALVRLNDGTYGTCIDCAQPIDLQRLAATPSAARCIVCQTQFESRAIPSEITTRP